MSNSGKAGIGWQTGALGTVRIYDGIYTRQPRIHAQSRDAELMGMKPDRPFLLAVGIGVSIAGKGYAVGTGASDRRYPRVRASVECRRYFAAMDVY